MLATNIRGSGEYSAAELQTAEIGELTMVEELNINEMDEVNGGSQESYNYGREIGRAIADTLAIIFG